MMPSELRRRIQRLAPATEDRARLLGWLDEYGSPGYYTRKGLNHDAKFAYNHLQNVRWVLLMAQAAGTPEFALRKARTAARRAPRGAGSKAAAVREVLPWEMVAALLCAKDTFTAMTEPHSWRET